MSKNKTKRHRKSKKTYGGLLTKDEIDLLVNCVETTKSADKWKFLHERHI